ncbi:alpha/beta-Hydrolases superfamily protein [Euphorbia peplus]|nr:alpha/beta-Hydrolases superfamily protein [Euphorbia peplus]
MHSDSTPVEVAFELPSICRLYKDGTVERFVGTEIVPPSPESEIKSKDVIYSPQFHLSLRLYLPKYLHTKVPLVLYIHGGAFCVYTAFHHPIYHTYLTKLAGEANVLIVSVDYRNAPEHPLPAAYEDAWTTLNWVTSHSNGDGPEEWVNHYADLDRVYIAGDSAGGNIAHNVGMRIGIERLKLEGVNVLGLVLVHPFFWGKEAIDGECKNAKMRLIWDGMWILANWDSISCLDDREINPGLDPNLSELGCGKVLVFVAEKDDLSRRGRHYYDSLKKSGWKGSVEIMESKDEHHVFHMFTKSTSDNALALMKMFVFFLNQSD